jgi:putative colanic acid biosynthesis UDP-glucose lipid carrier transferase
MAYSIVATFLALIYAALFANRFLTKFVCNIYRKKYFDSNKILIVGYNKMSVKLVEQLEANDINKKIIGYCEEERNVHELSKYPILGNIDNTMALCYEHRATEIYYTVTSSVNNHIEKFIAAAEQNCIRFKIVPNLELYLNNHTEVQYLDGMPIISQHKEPLQSMNNKVIKRSFDIIFSLFAILFINIWLIPLVALLIWIESRSAPIFFQKRSGKNNIPFSIFKFTSMHTSKDANNVQAVKNDARITKVGKFLRRTSLDEFPQFFNVLMGDMSIVGPRPHMLKHTDDYSKIIEKYMVRQFLKPGITGWAQVNGYRGETKNIYQMQKRVEHDIHYMENWSLQLDIKVIFLTIYNAIKGEDNAY